MSVRTDPRGDLSSAMQQTLHIDPAVMQSAAAASGPGPLMAPAPTSMPVDNNDQHLAAANDFNTSNPEHPLKRTVVINIRASLSDLCLRKQKATWSPPSAEATRAIFQQKKFTDLQGTSEAQGDLKSVVLHQMDMASQKSTFPIALGIRITAVDDSTFSQTGEAYSAISLPFANTHAPRLLQQDDTALAYEFARKFPGYTSDNLSDKGIHEVTARRFCLVSADHPLVSAISENAEKLQMGEISMMPEGLVKISSSLYETILPMVKTQVESQIKVRDLTHCAVTISPADYNSWHDARTELMAEAKAGLKARVEAELACTTDMDDIQKMRDGFAAEERLIEHDIDHTVHTFSTALDITYNFLSK